MRQASLSGSSHAINVTCTEFYDFMQQHVVRTFLYYKEKSVPSQNSKKWESELLTSSFYLLKPPMWDVWACVRSRTYVHVQTLADRVNNGWRCKQEEESSWALWVCVRACACVSCRFCAGRDLQCRQMGNYQAGDWRVFATVRNTNASVLSTDFATMQLEWKHED